MAEISISIMIVWQFNLVVAIFGRLFGALRSTDRAEKLWRVCGAVHQELWLFALPGIGFQAIEHWSTPDQKWMIIFTGFNLFNWWYYRNWPDDENRWKRRGKKAKEAVTRAGARLVVVPT